MNRPARILVITLGLMVAGALFGALSGIIGLAISLLITEGGIHMAEVPVMVLIPGALGGVIGAVAAPASGWLFLRQVPLGRAFVGSVLGAVLGGVVGWVAPVGNDEVTRAIGGAVIGYFLSVAVLRWRGQSGGAGGDAAGDTL